MAFEEERSFPRGGEKEFPRSNNTKKKKLKRRRDDSSTALEDSESKKKKSKTMDLKMFPRSSNTERDEIQRRSESENVEMTLNEFPCSSNIKRRSESENVKLKLNEMMSKHIVLLGCIREVGDLELKVDLPYRSFGYIPVSKISDEYSSYLRQCLQGNVEELQELPRMFKSSQYVITKIEEILKGDEFKIILSINPTVIQRGFSAEGVRKGSILPASVQSVENHGYIMNCGIPTVRAFLKKSCALEYEKIWNDGRPLWIGQVLRCVVNKCTKSEDYLNVDLQADPTVVASAKFSEDVKISWKYILPGMCFDLTVSKITSSGLCVKFSGDKNGFVGFNYTNLDRDEVSKGEVLQGRVLHVDSCKKVFFFTTHPKICQPEPFHPFKEIMKGEVFKNAQVIQIDKERALAFEKSSNVYHGYVAKSKHERATGSHCMCKVLEYDFLIHKYICTINRDIIKAKVCSIDEMKPGQVFDCVVRKSSSREIQLSVGLITGVVEPIHFNISSGYSGIVMNRKVTAKVLAVKKPTCEFTLKPELVHSTNPILTEFCDAKLGVVYDGVILNVSKTGLQVKFYNDYKVYVNPNMVFNPSSEDLEKTYFVGQLVSCCVNEIRNKNEKLILTAEPYVAEISLENQSETYPVQVGKPYTVCVEKLEPDGLSVKEQISGVTGWIPSAQLSDNPQIAKMICESYKKGDLLDTYCLRFDKKIMFTINPTFLKFFKKSGVVSSLKNHLIVPSVVTEVLSQGITVSVPTQKGVRDVIVPNNEICDGRLDVKSLEIHLFQTLMVKITKMFVRTAEGSCRLSCVMDKTMVTETSTLLLQDFLRCQKRIMKLWKSIGNPLGELQLGSRVKGIVIQVSSFGSLVELDAGPKAVMMPFHYRNVDLKQNMIVEGTIIYIDIVNQCVEISLMKHVEDLFPVIKNVPPVSYVNLVCSILVSRANILVASCISRRNSRRVYVPSRWHVNDLKTSPYFQIGTRAKVVAIEWTDDMIIAVPWKVVVVEKKAKVDNEKIIAANRVLDNNENHILENGVYCEIKNGGNNKQKVQKSEASAENSDSTSENHGNCDLTDERNIADNVNKKDAKRDIKTSISCNAHIEGKKKKKHKIGTKAENFESKWNIEMITTDNGSGIENEGSKMNENKIKCVSSFEQINSGRKLTGNANESSLLEDKVGFEPSKTNDRVEKKKTKSETSKLSPKNRIEEENLSHVSVFENSEKDYSSVICNSTKKKKKSLKNSLVLDEIQFQDQVSIVKEENKNINIVQSAERKLSEVYPITKTGNDGCEKKVDNKSTKNTSSETSKIVKQKSKKENKNLNKDKNYENLNTKIDKSNNECMKIKAGFFWNATLDQIPLINKEKMDEAESSDDETEVVVSKKKKRRLTISEKRELAREEEERLRKIEERLLDAEKNPQAADDFDRLVTSDPNNSQNWIKYMAYHLEATEIEKARAVAQRALKTISFREEQEKLNVWMAMLNLENLFGTNESLEKTFAEAVKMNDPYKVYMQSLNMYSTTKKFHELDKMVQLVTKKYKDNKNTWIDAGLACIKCGEVERSRQIMQKALKYLDKKDHIEVLTRFARMENEWGESERADTIMENILTSYPKRVDVWCVYVDMLVKAKKLDVARQVLDRAIIQKLPTSKMKSLFKKYVKFEQEYGTNEGAEKVREAAKNYVENLKS